MKKDSQSTQRNVCAQNDVSSKYTTKMTELQGGIDKLTQEERFQHIVFFQYFINQASKLTEKKGCYRKLENINKFV